jgi:hypothetical protein
MESAVRQQGLSGDAEGSDAPLAILLQEKNRLENAVVHLKVSPSNAPIARREGSYWVETKAALAAGQWKRGGT